MLCAAPSNPEILSGRAPQDRMAGVSRSCDSPPQAEEKPRCGGFLDPSIDSILAVKPDLVLAQTFLQEHAVKAFAHHEVRVLCFSCTSLSELLEDILLLGRLVERERTATDQDYRRHEDM